MEDKEKTIKSEDEDRELDLNDLDQVVGGLRQLPTYYDPSFES